MLKELMYKWFGLEPMPCPVCEVLREHLVKSENERRELLQRALAPPLSEPLPTGKEEYKPIQPQFIPWRVRQQMLEQEDRHKAKLSADKIKEIEELEKDLGVVSNSKE